MATVYFPSCRLTAYTPDTSIAVQQYLKKKHGFERSGCCRKAKHNLSASDTAIYICHTCAAILEESSKAKAITSLWEIIDNDPGFSYPDYSECHATVQDCWRSFDRYEEQKAVRSILEKMRIMIHEQRENFNKTHFCGVSLLNGSVAENNALAPNRFGRNGIFQTLSREQQEEQMTAHCSSIETNMVITYCIPCTKGIIAGGKKAVHLLDLLFDHNIQL